jgi:hypothetical protein
VTPNGWATLLIVVGWAAVLLWLAVAALDVLL